MQTPEASSPSIPTRLLCGNCRYWELTPIRALPNGEAVGQCLRFSEARLNGARPRCNICWEPPAPVLRMVPSPEGE